jgi:hypothetical protein
MLALLEVLERDGRVRRSVPVAAWPLTLGRALDNDVVLDDPHVAPHHLRIEPGADGQPEVLVLPSVNGLDRGRQRHAAGARLNLGVPGAGGEAQPQPGVADGKRLRLPGEVLAPERPLARVGSHATTLALVAVFWLWALFAHWLNADPGGKASAWVMPLLAAPAALLAWTGAWGLASKLFRHRLDFWPHLGVAVRGAVAIDAAGLVLPGLAAITGWSWLSRVAGGVGLVVMALTLLAHAALVLPHRRRLLAALTLAACTGTGALMFAFNQQSQDRWFKELYTATLPPPALQWAPRQTPAEFIAASESLLPRLEAAVRKAEAERKEAGEGEEE